MLDHADDVSCLRRQSAQKYANAYVDRQAGQPIVMFGLNNLIGQTFYGPTPSTDDLNILRSLNFLLSGPGLLSGCEETFNQQNKKGF